MKTRRPIIEIDESRCNGCGQCILACAEGALALVDGKAKLVGEILCDGLGACLGECPEGALKVVERVAEDFDEKAVEVRLETLKGVEKPDAWAPEKVHACPGSAAMRLNRQESACVEPVEAQASTLGHWPVKLQLLGPQAPFLKGADLLLVADCVGIAYPDVHGKLIRGKAVAIGCPKLDDLEAHVERLAAILQGARPRSLTVVHMEVPCCHGFVYAAKQAVECAGVEVPLRHVMISRTGRVLAEESLEAVGNAR